MMIIYFRSILFKFGEYCFFWVVKLWYYIKNCNYYVIILLMMNLYRYILLSVIK